jgi:hypothetical protein
LDELKKTGLLTTGQTISDVMRVNDLDDDENDDDDQLELDELITEDDIVVDLAEEHSDD